MQITSATAGKMIKSLEEEKEFILEREKLTSTYILSVGEKGEPPSYDYMQTQQAITVLDTKIAKLRCALHDFNSKTVLPNIGVSIDEALIQLAQLNNKAKRLDTMRKRLPKQRMSPLSFRRYEGVPSTPQYEYANYDIEKAEVDYQETSSRIKAIQLDIDLANQTYLFEVNLPS